MLDLSHTLNRQHITTGDEQSLWPGEVHNLGFSSRDKNLLTEINLNLHNRGITVIMGPNGAGKSLLLRLLHGMLEPHGGSIAWGGQPLNIEIRKRQAMVFQQPVLLRRSVAANIRFVLKLHKASDNQDIEQKIQSTLNSVGLAEQAKQPARLLSGGEQQRLSLARALVLSPEILFLDEPTASLDPASIATIESIITDARQHGTHVILVTHDIGQARRLADEVIFLEHGRITEQTPASGFFAEPKSQAAKDYLAGRLRF